MKPIALIGVGNVLFNDEGVGVYAVRYLEKNYEFSPEIDIIDGGTLGVRLSEYFLEYMKVFLVDTVSIEDAPGSVYVLPAEELAGLGVSRQTVHEVEVTQMLETCRLAGECAEVCIVGIIPEDIRSVSFGLSGVVKQRFPELIGSILGLLEKEGVKAYKKAQLSLEQIIASYADPSGVMVQ